jgi:hypothetical protein
MNTTDRRRRRATSIVMTAGAIAITGAVASASLAGPALAAPAGTPATASGTVYNFRTLDNPKDLTFNQLLGISNKGLIAGYFGSGAQGHPNKGYLLAPNGRYTDENFPGSAQTQVTGLNDRGATVGFWSGMNNANQVNDNHGWWSPDGRHFATADFPTASPATPPVDQLLGINNAGLAVGFYTDAAGNSHGYTFNTRTGKFAAVAFPATVGAASITAAAINNKGDIAGFFTDAAGNTDGFLSSGSGGFITLQFPGATATQALGVNDKDEVVGVYTDAAGKMHGFTWLPRGGFQSVDDPDGIGTTTVNGVNNAGDLVGFYTDAAGNTDGFAAAPVTRKVTVNFSLSPMPQGQLTVSAGSVSLTEFGFTPGSSHEVAASFLGLEIPLGTLTATAGGSVTWSVSLSTVQRAMAQHGIKRAAAGSGTPGIQLVILNAGPGTPVIAQTAPITGFGTFPVHAVEPGWGVIKPGLASITYDPAARTLSVTVDAFGLTPGAHAAHIHTGSCQQQGGVVYMLMDYTADAHGAIVHQTRTVTGVNAVELSGGWYLNLHQGNSNNILSNGQPTINFRPLLCSNF